MKNDFLNRSYSKCLYLVVICTFFTFLSCGGGGGGGDSSSTATGTFKDSNVSGLSYVSGNSSGITDQYGTFIYEVGQLVTFSVGGITLGSSTGKSVITPTDLVTNGNSSSRAVQNITRFLMMLDEDSNPDNGINISEQVQAVASNWTQVNFNTSDLATALQDIIQECSNADGGVHNLPDANTAKNHLEETMRCVYAGGYKGTYGGGSKGKFGVLVDARTGLVQGVGYSSSDEDYFFISGQNPIGYSQNPSFVSGVTSTGASFQGQFTSPNRVSGNWQNPYYGISGSFSGRRVGGFDDAVYRFTGEFSGDDYGLFTVDVDESNNLIGRAYSAYYDEEHNITGHLSGTSINATASNGTVITGTLDKASGDFSGTWVNPSGESGNFSGAGCRLN